MLYKYMAILLCILFFFFIGGLCFSSTVVFNISDSSFTNCSANNYNGGGTGGAIFTSSPSPGLRYLTNITFANNVAGKFFFYIKQIIFFIYIVDMDQIL